MFKIIELLLDIFCIVVALIGSVVLAAFAAAAMAVTFAGDAMDQIDKWLHRR